VALVCRRLARKATPFDHAGPSTAACSHRIQDDLDRSRSLLIGLPQHHAAVLVLHYLEDLEVDEIAKMLGIPVGTVKSRLSRAREALRNAQSPSEEEIQ